MKQGYQSMSSGFFDLLVLVVLLLVILYSGVIFIGLNDFHSSFTVDLYYFKQVVGVSLSGVVN